MILAIPISADQNRSSSNTSRLVLADNTVSVNQNDFWYNENVYMDISKDGWIWSRASLDGSDILFGDLDLSLLMQLEVLNIFRSVHIGVSQGQNPWDNNANVNFRFQTNNPDLAEQYAQFIILILSERLTLDLRFDGSNGFDDWDGDAWRPMTEVWFSGHVDWINMQSVINSAIPRSLGGLAANIDANFATHLSFNFWLEQSNLNIAGSIGLEYQQSVSQLNGGHSISYGDIMHITKFEKSPYSNDFRVSVSLPNVTNPPLPSFNVENTVPANWQYHPNPEGWDYHRYWDGDISIPINTVFDDVIVLFDYEFKPWALVNQDQYWWWVDPRGYDDIRIEATGNNRIAPTSGLYSSSPLLNNVASLNMWMDHNSMRIDVGFYNNTGNQEFDNILLELETLGFNYTDIYFPSNGSQWNWHNWVDNQNYMITWYSADLPLTEVDYNSIITNMTGYKNSAIMQYTNLTAFDSFSWSIDPDRWGNAARMSLNKHSLGNNLPLTEVDRLFNDIDLSHSVDLLQPLRAGWNGTIPWNNYSESLRMNFQAPFQGPLDNINFIPTENNGLYWDSGRWEWQQNQFNYFQYEVRIYNANPQLLDLNSNPTTPLNSISATFNNNFISDNVDIDPPNIDEVRFNSDQDFNFDLWFGDFQNTNLSGQMYLAAKVHDENDWRFPSSGIKGVNSTLFRPDAPVDHPKFLFKDVLTFAGNWSVNDPSREAWVLNLDTTTLADGEWEVGFDIVDNSNNINQWGSNRLIIDNYPETYQPANIVWDAQSSPSGADISGLMSFDFVVKDDAGSFAVIVWSNLGGFVIEPTNTIANASGIYEYYTFELDTLFEIENSPVTIKIDVLDMDGHWSSIDRQYIVNNYIVGTSPTINLLAPISAAVFNSSEQSEVEFRIEILEDVGIKSAEIFFEGPFSTSFVLTNELNTDIWTETVNILTWNLGHYEWYVTVVDMDENIHFATSVTRTFEIVGDSLFTPDNQSPVLSALNYANNDVVSGDITIQVKATDNVGIQEVSIAYYDGRQDSMTTVDDLNYEFNMNTAEVVDGKYDITITAKDFKGNSDSITIILEFDNGRDKKSPGLGIPGFEFYLSLFSLISLIIVHRKITKN